MAGMRRGLLIIALLAGGCCAHKPPPATQATATQPSVYTDAPVAALVFDPPIAAGETISLSREDRVPRAFIGYESGLAEFLYVRTDDRIREIGGWWNSSGNRDRFERRAVSTRVGVLQR